MMNLLCNCNPLQCQKRLSLLRLSEVLGTVRKRWHGKTSSSVTGMDKHLVKTNAQILWDYLRIDKPLKKSDLILVLGNSDLRTADHAANLYHQGLAPLLVVSGKEGHKTKGRWSKPEAVVFAEHLKSKLVPPQSILLETRATNTGENICFTQQLLRDQADPIQPGSVILVQTPFMGRRCLATFLKQWQGADQVDVMVSSPPIPMDKYPSASAGLQSLEEVMQEMVRSMERIQEYPSMGFQEHQDIPSNVMDAFHVLQQRLQML